MSNLVINQYPDGLSVYCRSHGLETDKLSALLCEKYNADSCAITPSGMSAIMTSLESLKFKNFNLITLDEMYVDTPKNIEKFCKKHGNNLHITTIENVRQVFEQLSGQTNVLFIESCSNPSGKIFDFSLIPLFKSLSKEFVFIVDNTWLSCCIFNPFNYGADIVVVSLTKYYSGGNAICGAVIAKENYFGGIIDWLSYIGNHVSPHNAQIVHESMGNMNDRIKLSSSKTILILDELRNNNQISELNHPYIHSFQLCQKYLAQDLYPSVFTFCILMSMAKFRKLMTKLTIIEVKTSFGHPNTCLDPWIKRIEIGKKGYVRVRVRIAIGHEDSLEKIRMGLQELFTLVKMN